MNYRIEPSLGEIFDHLDKLFQEIELKQEEEK